MKKLLLAVLLSIAGAAGYAQTLRITNTTSCDIGFIARASDDAGGMSACNHAYWTNMTIIPPGGSIMLTAADLLTPPATMPFYWSHVRFYDPVFPNCPAPGPGPCPAWTGHMNVGDPNCGMSPPVDCMNFAPCSPCAGGAANAVWTWLTPIDADIMVTP